MYMNMGGEGVCEGGHSLHLLDLFALWVVFGNGVIGICWELRE